MVSSKVHGKDKDLEEWVRALGIDPGMTRRIIIDIQANEMVRVYIEQYLSRNMLTLSLPTALSNAVHINIDEKQDEAKDEAKDEA